MHKVLDGIAYTGRKSVLWTGTHLEHCRIIVWPDGDKDQDCVGSLLCWCDEYYSPKEFEEKGVCLACASQSQSITEKSRVVALAGPVGGNVEERLLACSLGLLTFLSCRTEDHLSWLGLAWLTSIVQQENASQIFLQLKLMATVLQLRIFLKVFTLSRVEETKLNQTKSLQNT